jgi:hypothetical protein
VTCYTQPCKPCKLTYILHYLPQGDESSPRGRWGICAPALPEVLTLMYYNKTAFSPPGCKIIAHEKPVKRRTWAPHGQHVYSLGPAMHHYRCQNVYILATASERIVDTLEFSPHNYQMPQMCCTDRFLMVAKDIRMLYKTLTRKCHSLTSGMTPSRHLLSWLIFSNSNYGKLNLPPFQLRLPRSTYAHASPNHPIQS